MVFDVFYLFKKNLQPLCKLKKVKTHYGDPPFGALLGVVL